MSVRVAVGVAEDEMEIVGVAEDVVEAVALFEGELLHV